MRQSVDGSERRIRFVAPNDVIVRLRRERCARQEERYNEQKFTHGGD
jgi:hypothetical protein